MLGIMVVRDARWLLRSYLRRHAAIFELLAVLDGSTDPGDMEWTARLCASYRNILYGHERDANLTVPTDQTTRAAATQLLLRGLSARQGDDAALLERWVLLAHPDEFFVQDPRDLVAEVARRDPLASTVLFDIVYVLPTPEERGALLAHAGNRTHGVDAFEPIDHLQSCDATYAYREPRLIKWTRGTRWGRRHGLTTPQVHPGHRVWPVARDVAQRRSPFYVHFKIHSFNPVRRSHRLKAATTASVQHAPRRPLLRLARVRTGRIRRPVGPPWWHMDRLPRQRLCNRPRGPSSARERFSALRELRRDEPSVFVLRALWAQPRSGA